MYSAAACEVYGPEVFVEEALLVPDPVGREGVHESVEEWEHYVPYEVRTLCHRPTHLKSVKWNY